MLEDKILIADDEPNILESLSTIIKDSGFTVLTAANGVEALQLAKANKPKVVILDVMMPQKDGYQTCAELRRDPTLAGMHIILLTARGQTRDKLEGMAMGANEYITKPFNPMHLLNRIREIIPI